jgi:hypothetical protein
MSIFNFFSRPKAQERVTFTSEEVVRVRPGGIEERIRWDDLHEVVILTTDEGPWLEDVFFLLIASDGKSGCAVPQSSDGCKELLERLQQLPGFDNKAVINAMGSASNAKFLCWRRQGG